MKSNNLQIKWAKILEVIQVYTQVDVKGSKSGASKYTYKAPASQTNSLM